MNNTITQPAGDGLRVEGNSRDLDVRNNVFAVAAGPAVRVADNSQVGFTADYNQYHLTGTVTVARWQGQSFTTVAGWY